MRADKNRQSARADRPIRYPLGQRRPRRARTRPAHQFRTRPAPPGPVTAHRSRTTASVNPGPPPSPLSRDQQQKDRPQDQAIALLDAADSDADPQAARTAALVATLLFTGARGVRAARRGHRGPRHRPRAPGAARAPQGRQDPGPGASGPAAGRIDAYLAGRDDVTALPALPGQRGRAAAPGPVCHRLRGADVPGRGARPAPPPLRRLGRLAHTPKGEFR